MQSARHSAGRWRTWSTRFRRACGARAGARKARARAESNPNQSHIGNAWNSRRNRDETAKKYDGSPNYLLTKMQPSNYFKSQMMNALFPPNLDMDLNRVFIHKPGSVRRASPP